MKRLLLWGVGIAVGIWIFQTLRSTSSSSDRKIEHTALDLNGASIEDLMQLPGVDESIAERILENRPYRHRLDLVARKIIPAWVYQEIHLLVDVDHDAAAQAINLGH